MNSCTTTSGFRGPGSPATGGPNRMELPAGLNAALLVAAGVSRMTGTWSLFATPINSQHRPTSPAVTVSQSVVTALAVFITLSTSVAQHLYISKGAVKVHRLMSL